jgi:hypothetical protein
MNVTLYVHNEVFWDAATAYVVADFPITVRILAERSVLDLRNSTGGDIPLLQALLYYSEVNFALHCIPQSQTGFSVTESAWGWPT